MSGSNPVLDDLIGLLKLERLEVNLFRGQSRDIGSKQVYGGQVLGQALSAAAYTVEERTIHSLHAYFLRRGDMHAPIIYEVDRQRDGRSFSNRRVVAIQHGRPILNLAASFQVAEEGLIHAQRAPEVPRPEELPEPADSIAGIDKLPAKMRRFLLEFRPFDFRWVEPPQYENPQPAEPRRHLWFRTAGKLPDDPDLHRSLMAYASDYGLLTTALLPHAMSLLSENLQLASLDHAIWFHRPFRMDEWLLYCYDSPTAVNARGLSRGQLFDHGGTLVASVTQEGLMRVWPEGSS